MKKRLRTNHELWNCTMDLLRFIRWPFVIAMTFASGSLYYYLSAQYIDKAYTYQDLFCGYWSCPLNCNFIQIVAFYIVTFLPTFFELKFLSCKICSEYYIVRLRKKQEFVLAKIFCIVVVNVSIIFLRLLLLKVYSFFLNQSALMAANTLLPLLFQLLLTYLTFGIMVFLCYSIINDAVTTFVLFSVLFMLSLQLDALGAESIMFWIYGMNMRNLTINNIYRNVMLLVVAITILLVRRVDIIEKEDEKNE